MQDSKKSQPNAVAMLEAPSFLNVLEKAMESGNVDASKLETLLNVQLRVMDKQAEIDFNTAMVKLQGELPLIRKNGTIDYGKGKPIKFATIDDIEKAIRPIYLRNGFTFSYTQNGNVYTGTVKHVGGHSMTSKLELNPDTSGGKNPIQAVVSAGSYARRTHMKNLLSLVFEGEDDDANSAHAVLSDEQAAEIKNLIAKSGANVKKFLETYKCASVDAMAAGHYVTAKNLLESKIRLNEKKTKDDFNAE